MKIFKYVIQYEQAINHAFDQDDIKTVGKRRVQGRITVVAPDRELGDLYLKRSFTHRELEVVDVQEEPIHMFVTAEGRTIATTSAHSVVPMGPDVIDPHWKEALERDARSSW